MRAADHYALQLAIECKAVLPSGRMIQLPGDDPDPIALITVVRFLDAGGEFVRLRDDVTDRDAELLGALSVAQLLALPASGPVGSVVLKRHFAGCTGIFPNSFQPASPGMAEREGEAWVIKRDGHVVCSAVSARENGAAAELGCQTLAGFRRLGYGSRVCSAWAQEVLDSGRVAFYSYDFTNVASQRLATSLGVIPQFEAGSFDLLDDPGGHI